MKKIMTLIVMLALASYSLPSVASAPAPLQIATGPFAAVAQADWQVTRLAAQRGRLVTVDFDYLARNTTWTLNLFADVRLEAIIERSEPTPSGGTIWYGRIADEKYSSVTAVAENGILMANINLLSGQYMVEYVSPGVHAVYQIDQTAFPPELHPVAVDTPENATTDNAASDSAAPRDDGSQIDVLVAYTPSARAAVGGTAAMQALITLAVAETNQAYQNSQVTQRLRLVHAYETTYTEAGFSSDLTRVRGMADGYMDEVHALRDTYAADEVVLIINTASACGLAYLMNTVSSTFATSAFAVVHYDCATGYYSFAHELGHNMGSEHDRANAFSPEGAYTYSYGYQSPTNLFRTVMAYNCAASDCPRVQYFSNPEVTYSGQPTGIISTAGNAADNRLSLNNTAYTVANFRVADRPYKMYVALVQKIVNP